MTRKSATTAADPSDLGWAALAEARWQEASDLFEAALSVAETPEALEGLSWAAWWLDDAAVVFDARERAYRTYRRSGNARAAARMATWLAADQLDFHGAWAVASGWLSRAHRLLDHIDPGPDHGWLAFHEGFIAFSRGDTTAARERAALAAELGRRFVVPDLEMLGLALDGAALVACCDVENGMRCLDEATAMALEGDATIPISGAWACCLLVTACTATLDYDRASEWCARIRDFAERYGSRYMLAFCRTEYGAVHIWQGRWSDAESLLKDAREDYSRSRPAWSDAPLVALAELRRRQGRHSEAVQLLDEASPSPAATVCRAAVALDRGQALRAAEILERLLRQLPADQALGRVPALRLLARARVARGELGEAASSVAVLQEIARAVRTTPLRSCAQLAEGMLAAATGVHERSRPLLEDAVDGFERSGAPFEAAQARIELAVSLVALGRTDVAREEASAALEALLELGAVLEADRAKSTLETAGGREGPLAELTTREREVVGLLADGLTNREIAARLVVSEHTVHRHVTNILSKLDVPSRTAAAALAVRAGLPDSPHV